MTATRDLGGIAPVILETAELGIRFGGLAAVSDVALSIRRGERRLLLGPNGAGKTTLFNLITGDLKATSGTIRLMGRDVSALPPRKRAAVGLARTYQILTLFPEDTLRHNVVLALLAQERSRWNPFATLAGRSELWTRADAALARVGLDAFGHRVVKETAYGIRRRLEIAIALAQEPKLLLLDEPLAGLSAEERQEVQKLIAGIDRDVTVILIEHDMDVALQLADRVTLMQSGRIVVDGTRDEVAADPRTREIYLGQH
jgi:branched-chain amino acid transport system ATP-binding protein